ncbi:hypothetical protein [Fischerella sp. NIES-3754]|uniref:hypothetical protein n=1 Tax=Fischerella sp. NIES-3754 TaxID=1752063 RepID=UPI003FA46587
MSDRLIRIGVCVQKLRSHNLIYSAKISLSATPAFLQQTNQYHLQSGVAVSVKYHALCEMERLSLDHLRGEIACANPSGALLQNQGSLEYEQPLVASGREY